MANENFDYRARDALYFRFHDIHPHRTADAVAAGIWPTYPVGNRRLIRLRKRTRGRKPRLVGTVAMHDTGRAANIFCAWRPGSLLHEVRLTAELVRLPIPLHLWTRGSKTSRQFRPDAELESLFVEFDTGTEKRPQLQRQARAYHQTERLVLWMVPGVKQIEWLRQVAKPDTTLVMLHGGSEIFDLKGRTASVEQVCARILGLLQHPVAGT